MAAGALLVQEAGGVVVDPADKDFDLMSRRILVASTQDLVQDWMTQVDYQTDVYPRDFPEEIKPLKYND